MRDAPRGKTQEDRAEAGPVCNRTKKGVRLETGPTETEPFRGLDKASPITIYHRHMPHWRQDGVWYFVTFRLADSIPLAIMERWMEQDRIWLAAHGITEALSEEERRARYNALSQMERGAFEREKARRLLVELDQCHGSCVLRNLAAAEIVSQALLFHEGQRIECGDFVVMPNHVHWLVWPWPGEELDSILHSVKRFSAQRINSLVGRSGALWQHESHDHIVRDEDEFDGIRSYIELNPEKANLKPLEYVYHRSE